MSPQKTVEHHMRQVLTLAAEALEQGEFPIAAIVVLDDEIIAQATTSEQREKRFLVHAELAALEEADKRQTNFRPAAPSPALYQPGAVPDVHGRSYVFLSG